MLLKSQRFLSKYQRFWSNIENFGQILMILFGQNLKGFGQNLKCFSQTPKNDDLNLKGLVKISDVLDIKCRYAGIHCKKSFGFVLK